MYTSNKTTLTIHAWTWFDKKHDGLNKVYNITLKGFQYLEFYKQIRDLVKIE